MFQKIGSRGKSLIKNKPGVFSFGKALFMYCWTGILPISIYWENRLLFFVCDLVSAQIIKSNTIKMKNAFGFGKT